MRVFIINSFFSVGGPPHVVKGICDALKNNGDTYILAASREKQIPGMSTVRIGAPIHVYMAAIKTRLFDNEGFSSKRATAELINKIRQFKPDIIHLHNLHGYYLNIELLFDYLKKCEIPVVWTLHDCWPITGHCCHFAYVECNKWQEKGCNHCPQKKEYPTSILLDRSRINYTKKRAAFLGVKNLTIVTVSKWLKSIVKKSFLKEYPVKVIYNGINSNVFYPRKEAPQIVRGCKKKIILGVAQNWGIKKGLHDFVKLSKLISDEYLIVLVGLEGNELPEKRDNILVISKTNSQDELAEWYSAAYVFLNLSYEETFGLVTAEALACGTPVIVYDATATGEIVENGVNGYKIPAGNINEVWRSIENINMVDSAKYYCNYTEDIMKDHYLNLYKSLIGENK